MTKEQKIFLRKEINETKISIEEEVALKLADAERQNTSFTNAKFNELKKKLEDVLRSPRVKMSGN